MTARHQLRDAILRPASRMTRRRSESTSNTVLIFQPDHLGDILLSQPAVTRIRRDFPGHRLIGVVGPWSESFTRQVWPVDDVIGVDFPGFNRGSATSSPTQPYLQLREQAAVLRRLDASISFVLRPDAWWAAWLAALVTGGPVVASDDPRVHPFATHRARLDKNGHASVRAFAIANALSQHLAESGVSPETDPLSIPAQADANDQARRLLLGLGIKDEYIVIHPGAGAPVKQWPSDRWRVVASELGCGNMPILITGASNESELGGSIASSGPMVTSIAGQTPLPILVEILRGAKVVLGPDSGPLHIAVACSTPTVHLFGPSDPTRYGPWGSPGRHRVISSAWSCPRCGDLSVSRPDGCGCMAAIEPQMVIDAAQSLMECHVHQ